MIQTNKLVGVYVLIINTFEGCKMRVMMIWKRLHERHVFFAQTVQTSSVSHSQFDKHLIMPQISRLQHLCVDIMPPKTIHAFWGQWPLCHWAEYNNYNGSQSRDHVFLTGCKWRQTHLGRNCAHPYPIRRRIWKILEELSTFTFHQPTRWVGLTNSKNTGRSQSTISYNTKVILFYSINKYSKRSLGQLWDATDPKSIQSLASKKLF
jgi:hypothetical protein